MFFHYSISHFENLRSLPTPECFDWHYCIPCIWKHKCRHQDHVPMCLRTGNTAFSTFVRWPFWNPKWLPTIDYFYWTTFYPSYPQAWV